MHRAHLKERERQGRKNIKNYIPDRLDTREFIYNVRLKKTIYTNQTFMLCNQTEMDAIQQQAYPPNETLTTKINMTE